MNVQIQGGGKNAGVYANTGSCAALLEYLKHEDAERLAQGLEILPFVNGLGIEVSPGEVLQKIDRNHKKLHYEDAKFYHLDINPSQEELRAMGNTEAEIIANIYGSLIPKLTQIYADNFHKEIVVGKDAAGNDIKRMLSAEDIMVFWKVHTTREEKEGLQIHIHGIPSRKDIHNRLQLSPMTNHKKTSKGAVTGGFERTALYRSIEEGFDEMFGYDRQLSETFNYCNEHKKGSQEQKESLEAQLTVSERETIIEKHAERAVPDITDKIVASLARRDLRRRNEFWNDFHSKYRPQYESLQKVCGKSFTLYQDAKEKYGVCSREISEKYNELRSVYGRMNDAYADVQRAKTAKGLLKAASALVFLMNPIAGIALRLVGGIIAESEKSSANATRAALRAQAQAIREDISELKVRQAELRQDKTDKLHIYIENKEAKTALQNEINSLKAALDTPLPPEQQEVSIEDFLAGYNQYQEDKKTQQEKSNPEYNPNIEAYLHKDDFREAFTAARSEQGLRRELAGKGLTYSVVRNSKGVSDFEITAGGEKPYTVFVSSFGEDYARQMLDLHEKTTGQKPAYKTVLEEQRAQRVRIAQGTSRQIEAQNIAAKQAREAAEKAKQAQTQQQQQQATTQKTQQTQKAPQPVNQTVTKTKEFKL